MNRQEQPTYMALFTELRETHPWPQTPNGFGDAMHALARAHGIDDATANVYGDKARDWALATWRDMRRERRPLTIIDTRDARWVYALDNQGQEWAIRADVYLAIHRQAHEREMRLSGQRFLTLSRIEEINRMTDSDPRILHTSYRGIYPVVVVADPDTGQQRRKILSRTFGDDESPSSSP